MVNYFVLYFIYNYVQILTQIKPRMFYKFTNFTSPKEKVHTHKITKLFPNRLKVPFGNWTSQNI